MFRLCLMSLCIWPYQQFCRTKTCLSIYSKWWSKSLKHVICPSVFSNTLKQISSSYSTSPPKRTCTAPSIKPKSQFVHRNGNVLLWSYTIYHRTQTTRVPASNMWLEYSHRTNEHYSAVVYPQSVYKFVQCTLIVWLYFLQ